MQKVLDGISKNNFVVLGRAGMDIFPDPPGTRTEDAETLKVGLGGSSANIAVGIIKLGGQASLVTSVSDDSIGKYCLNQLESYGVNCSFVRAVGGEYRNSLAVYESRVEDHQTVIYRNGAADFQFTKEDAEQVNYNDFGALVTAGTVFASEPSRSATFHAFDLARTAGLPIIFDIDYRPYSWPSPQIAEEVLSRAGALSDVIVGNDEEFGFMAGGINKGLDKARALSQSTAQIVIYKMGENGAITFADGDEISTGIYTVKALKPTGAGDSFMAGFLAGLANNVSLHDSVLRGSACAAIVVGRPGCAPAMPYNHDLDIFLTQHRGPSDVKA